MSFYDKICLLYDTADCLTTEATGMLNLLLWVRGELA